MSQTRGIGGEARVGGELGGSERFAEAPKERVVSGSDGHPAVARREGFVRREIGMAIAQATGRLAGRPVVRGMIGQKPDLPIEKRGIHTLADAGALAMIERDQD